MRTVLFIPPLPRMSGGIAVLYQLANRLRELGHDCRFATTNPDAPGLAEQREKGFAVLPLPTSGNGAGTPFPGMGPEDAYVVPEGWPNALAPGLKASMRCLVYVQNWAYLLPALPENVRWASLPVSFLAVSQPVAWFLKDVLHLPVAGIVRPALDRERYIPGDKSGKTIRIAWMPRKNKALGEQIRGIAEAALFSAQGAGNETLPPLEWLPLHRMSATEVAEGLGRSHIFLATGFPEGFGLPALEAMACGCLPVGFSGFGGWDYMREARSIHQAVCSPAQLPLRETIWPGNGFYATDGDVLGAALALKEAVTLFAHNDHFLETILSAGRVTADSYSPTAQREEVRTVWTQLLP